MFKIETQFAALSYQGNARRRNSKNSQHNDITVKILRMWKKLCDKFHFDNITQRKPPKLEQFFEIRSMRKIKILSFKIYFVVNELFRIGADN